ncbi:ATP-binding protein [Psychroserpens sp. Hel_I_66]|uniref:ATP-binding protein n=1 Tax=Psychroserpens sp. Hel_I_66 TaxID=1250004 RepID=UPI00064604E0|nr:ATP-binding protein [Psychroserpens sp. Hel_I_66]
MKFNRRYLLLLTIAINLFFLSCFDKKDSGIEKDVIKLRDSVNVLMSSSKNNSYSILERKNFLNKSYNLIKSSEIDTLLVRNLSVLAYQNLKFGDTLLFMERNKEVLHIAEKIKDSFALGDIHWNFASYYNKKHVFDSAYYHFYLAHEFFDKSNFIFESAKTQYGMAYIKGIYKDYSGSEVLTFKAINKFKKIEDNESLFSCYNHLGALQNDIYEYDKSLFYYNKSLGYLDKIESSEIQHGAIQNNIGNTYLKKGEYSKAIEHFKVVLNINNIRSKNPSHYARVLSNKAFAELLNRDTINVESTLLESLKIRDSLKNKGGIIISKIHLSHFYDYKKDVVKAIEYATEANILANEIKNSRDYLESLMLLSNIDTVNSSKYYRRYIQFNDSIQMMDRKIQNKFTRIAYETDEYIEETKRLTKQNIWILISSFGLISILVLLYLIKIQKTKNEKLLLENEEQKANEQIYLITLRQQEKLEKEKINERNRIAEELHDGILGKLFGTRVGLGFLEIEGNKNLKDQHQLFLEELQNIEKEIREVSHKLSDNFETIQISFTTIIKQLVENKSKLGNFKYRVEINENIHWENIDKIIKVNLYRIIQEALQNIIKYSFSKNVNLIFFFAENELTVTISDDGVGFDIRHKKKGIGLKNMNSRVKKLNGSFEIHSQINKGTLIKIIIPI